MESVILDACGTINLYATGRFVPILSAVPRAWHLPAAAEREARQYRQPDPADPTRLVVHPVDLGPALAAGCLTRCDCESDAETDLFVKLAAQIGDGESMGIAIAKCRGWGVLTDDKKARRIATEHGVPVVGTPEVLREWAVTTAVDEADLATTLLAVERFANYRPRPSAMVYDWWVAARSRRQSG